MQKIEQLLDFRDKTCLITGAANGIGIAITHRFAEAGARLLLVDNHRKSLERLERKLSSSNKRFRTFVIDLSYKDQIDQLWVQLKNEEIDVLVNNAGIFPFVDFLQLNEDDLNRVMNLNLYSVMWMCQHFIKSRLKKGGSIVNLGSIEAIMPFKKDLTQYSMSKVGVITLTRDLAREFAGKNFNINAILPGGIITKGTKSAAKKAISTMNLGMISEGYNFKQRIPAGRLGKPDEIAKMVLILSSEFASYMHGALIPIDGGFLSA